ncbi:MAG: hypothetical protein FJW23_04455 [Acidimicrobiia bacterium]|nr:hypothetical protein [Acidimicrobiia bacterium]
MSFARIVFAAAGVWGLVVVTPLYFQMDVTGRPYPPPTEYPHFFYGFLAVTLAWQVAFLVIALNPTRLRAIMIPCVIEKLGYVATVTVLHSQGLISMDDALTAAPDLVLGLLFIMAFARTPSSSHAIDQSRLR